MTQHITKNKNCAVCNQPITFEEFCQINPSISNKKASEYWNDPMILIYCPHCYFNLPERPFKRRRGCFNYMSRLRTKS